MFEIRFFFYFFISVVLSTHSVLAQNPKGPERVAELNIRFSGPEVLQKIRSDFSGCGKNSNCVLNLLRKLTHEAAAAANEALYSVSADARAEIIKDCVGDQFKVVWCWKTNAQALQLTSPLSGRDLEGLINQVDYSIRWLDHTLLSLGKTAIVLKLANEKFPRVVKVEKFKEIFNAYLMVGKRLKTSGPYLTNFERSSPKKAMNNDEKGLTLEMKIRKEGGFPFETVISPYGYCHKVDAKIGKRKKLDLDEIITLKAAFPGLGLKEKSSHDYTIIFHFGRYNCHSDEFTFTENADNLGFIQEMIFNNTVEFRVFDGLYWYR
jgi:hypothetical protein